MYNKYNFIKYFNHISIFLIFDKKKKMTTVKEVKIKFK
jgi:hypothetical protein